MLFQVKGEFTLAENIADHAGAVAGFKVIRIIEYKNEYISTIRTQVQFW